MIKRIWLTVVAMILFCTVAQAKSIAITVAAEPLVRGPMLTLGELAAITGDDAVEIEHFRRIALGSAPPPGGKLTLTREMLGMRLAASGADFANVIWEVPAAIVITTGSQTVKSADLLIAAGKQLERQLSRPGENDTVTIVPATNPADILAPLGNIELKAEIPYGFRFNAITTVHVAIYADEKLFTTVVVKYNIRKKERVVVTYQDIPARQILTQSDLTYSQADTGRLATGYLTDINQAIGLITRRALAAGTVLNDSFLDKPVIVKRGSLITIVAKGEQFEVSANGKALQDGSAGQIIRVQNIVSKRVISAEVIDSSTVEALTHRRK